MQQKRSVPKLSRRRVKQDVFALVVDGGAGVGPQLDPLHVLVVIHGQLKLSKFRNLY